MENKNEVTIFICTLVGAIADIVAILTSDFKKPALLSVLSLLILLATIIVLYHKYKERCDFLQFVEHLFDNTTKKFTLLPKICMALDGAKIKNDFHVTTMSVRHIFDFSKVNIESITEDSKVNCDGISEYTLIVENRRIPKVFSCYLGDMYSNPASSIWQKYGHKTEYEKVPEPKNRDSVRSAVSALSWELNKSHITGDKSLPISFKIQQSGKATANSERAIVFYPRQFGRIVDCVNFEISFICSKVVLKRVELFKIWKNGNEYIHTPITGVEILDNTAKKSITPDTKGYQAYYFKVYFELVETKVSSDQEPLL